MSQAKVDRYKDEQKNSKKNMKKEKVQNIIRRCAVCVIAVALIGCAGYSVHNIYESKKPTEKVTVDYSAMTTLSQSLAGNSDTTAEQYKINLERLSEQKHFLFTIFLP